MVSLSSASLSVFSCGPKILVLSCYAQVISIQEAPDSNMDRSVIGIDVVKDRS